MSRMFCGSTDIDVLSNASPAKVCPPEYHTLVGSPFGERVSTFSGMMSALTVIVSGVILERTTATLSSSSAATAWRSP